VMCLVNIISTHEKHTGDGGKWVCSPHRISQVAQKDEHKCLIYSVGSNGDVSFETGLYSILASGKNETSCKIHVFDPMDYSSQVPSGIQSMIQFLPCGIAGTSSVSNCCD
jgi:hypothetical protein